MYLANDIAKYFLRRSVAENVAISNLKLQKMLYIAHGLHLALTGEPLIEEKIECWPYGPVIKEIYDEYRGFGNGPITAVLDCPGSYNFSPQARQALDFTWQTTRDIDAIRLSNWSHLKGSPWQRAFNENMLVIPNNYIEEYFKNFLKENPQ